MDLEKQTYIAALRAQVVSLDARWGALISFGLNTACQVEAGVTLRQIEALKAELARIQEAK